jgi:adenosylhomocysteine nucleosidase
VKTGPGRVWFCFALPEERRFAELEAESVLVTGMGPRRARRALEAALERRVAPHLVWSCGFAGGLHPSWKTGAVLFQPPAERGPFWRDCLRQSGAVEGRFVAAQRVAVTAEEKRRLHADTGADAVDMESGALAEVCRERGMDFGIIRVISDAAQEDLPLDFNRLMTAEDRLHWGRLLWAVAASPGRISGLLRLRRQTLVAARALGAVLTGVGREVESGSGLGSGPGQSVP